MAQFRGGRAQRPRGGRQETGYAAPAADYDYSAQPAYGDDQDVYQVRLYCTVLYCTVLETVTPLTSRPCRQFSTNEVTAGNC